MTNAIKISAITLAAIAVAYAITLIKSDEPTKPIEMVKASNEVIKAPVSLKPDVTTVTQPVTITENASLNNIANEQLKHQGENKTEPKDKLARNTRLAPPPPLAPGESASSRHNESAKSNDRGHGHNHPNTTKTDHTNQPAPPTGADL